MAAEAAALKHALRGLYVITEDRPTRTRPLLTGVEAALRGGARIVQYRDKSIDVGRRLDEAQRLRQLCDQYDALFLINDDVRLAADAGADGVHLGRDDPDITAARRQLPANALIGVSCYNEYALALRAAEQGASYVAFGSFHPSPTKPQAVRAQPELLQQTRRELVLPAVAIGGISLENGAALVNAGADMLAVISAVFAAPDVESAARAFTACFNRSEETDR